MPYKSAADRKAEREAEQWMTLVEAVTHIRHADGCDTAEARRQFLSALDDGALKPLRWRHEAGDVLPPRIIGSSIIVPGDAPFIGDHWSGTMIDWETGRVRDDWSNYNHGKLRILLLPRAEVERLWKSTSSAGGSKPPPVTRPSPSARQTLRDDVDRMYLERRDAFRNAEGRPPSIKEDEVWAKENGLSRPRIRQLRAKHLTDGEKKGGRRKKKSAVGNSAEIN